MYFWFVIITYAQHSFLFWVTFQSYLIEKSKINMT